jgi:hypothetical protein
MYRRCSPSSRRGACNWRKGFGHSRIRRALRLLDLLQNPAAFDGPPGEDGRPYGVTAKALLRHLRCAQPSLNEQMAIFIGIGLVESRKIGRFVVYARDEERIRQLKQTIIDQLLPPAKPAQ